MLPIFTQMCRTPTRLRFEELVEIKQPDETYRQHPHVHGCVCGSQIISSQDLREQQGASIDGLGQTASAVPCGSLQWLIMRVRLCNATRALINLLSPSLERRNCRLCLGSKKIRGLVCHKSQTSVWQLNTSISLSILCNCVHHLWFFFLNQLFQGLQCVYLCSWQNLAHFW